MLSSHLNCVEIRCSETRIQHRRSKEQTRASETGRERGIEDRRTGEEGRGGRVWNAGSASPSGYNGKMEGMGLGRKFANFHDGARIISGWLGGFRSWQMTVVSGYWLQRRPPSHSKSRRMSLRVLSNAQGVDNTPAKKCNCRHNYLSSSAAVPLYIFFSLYGIILIYSNILTWFIIDIILICNC